MLIRLLLLLGAVAPYALADVEFTTPKAGATVAGGSTFKVEWKDSGSEPKLSSLQTYQLFLCAGGNDDPNLVRQPRAQDLFLLESHGLTGFNSFKLLS